MSRADEQINPKDRDRYTVIPRVLILLFHEKSVLLIKGSPEKKLWPGKYNGLGGHIERGEDPLSAARRELGEESGLNCHSLELCGTIMVDTGKNPGVAIYVYRGNYEGGKIRPSIEGNLEWINYERMHELPLVEDLYTIIPMITNRKSSEKVFSARYYYDQDDKFRMKFSEP